MVRVNDTSEPEDERQSASHKRLWLVILFLLLLLEIACLSFTSLDDLLVKSTEQVVVPVPLQPHKRADYSVDPGDYLSPEIDLSILIDILDELELDEESLNNRLATVTAMLAEPIPSATLDPSAGVTQPPATSTATAVPSSTSQVTPSVTNAATPSQSAQITATTIPATPSRTSTKPAATSTSANRTATSTHKPTRTVTRTPTVALTASSTATQTGTSTQPVPATSTSTSTLTPTQAATRTPTRTPTRTASATATRTDTAISTPTQTRTSAPGWTHTPTPTSPASLTPTPTRTTTPLYTHTPTRTATSTSTTSATPTSTNTATITPTPTGTDTPTPTPTATDTLLPTPTSTSTITPTPTDTVVPTHTNTPTATATESYCYPYPANGFVPSQDTWINKLAPDQSFGSDVQLHIRPVNGVDRRALIQFDLTSIPQGSTILSAVLYVNDETGEDSYSIYIYPIAEAWPESVTWNTAPAFNSTMIGSFNLTYTPCVRAAWLDVAQVSAWVNNPASNFGVLLYADANSGEVLLTSREGALPAKLVIDYQPPRGQTDDINSMQTSISKNYSTTSSVQQPAHPAAAQPARPGSSMRRR